MNRTIKPIIALSFLIVLTACNTVAGIGEDITASADWAKQKIGSPSKTTEDQQNLAPQADTSSSGKAPK
jgi:predicted small secreted protein